MILETLVLKGMLGMSEEDIAAKRGIGYAKSVDEALRRSTKAARRRLPPPPHPGRAGARRRRRRRDDAPEVDLLLPQGPHGNRLQPAELMKIYTRKGDDGTTSLWYGGGSPSPTPAPRPTATLDEAGSALGVARSLCGAGDAEVAADILRLQNELFVAGAELATAPRRPSGSRTASAASPTAMVESLEPAIDRYMDRVELPPKFVIPGGTTLSAQLDVARAVLRRAERRVVALQQADELASEAVLRYLNRASDLALRDGALHRRRRPGALRGPGAGSWRLARSTRSPPPGLHPRRRGRGGHT